MYDHTDIPAMQQRVANIDSALSYNPDVSKNDFYRVGIEVYVGSFPDVSGPDFIIDSLDEKGIEIFRQFCRQMAEHYKSLK